MKTQPLAGEAAEREAAKIRPVLAQVVEQGEYIAAELVERVGQRGNTASAMTAGVIAKDAMMRFEGRNNLVPHLQARTQRIAEHQQFRARAAEFVVDSHRSVVNCRHAALRVPAR